MKSRHKTTQSSRGRSNEKSGKTKVEGQNPQANDSPDMDLYHDENRRNMYDPEVAEALKRPRRGHGSHK